jgi:phenylacetate-CoA ligase
MSHGKSPISVLLLLVASVTDSPPTDLDRELWDPLLQAPDPLQARQDAEAGLRREWARPWDDPLPFYRSKLELAGFVPGEMPDLADIPRTTKSELRQDVLANPPFGSHRSIRLEDAARVGMSTGTTGKPWLIFFTAHDLDEMIPNRLAWLWRAGIRPGGRLSHSWPMGLYPTGSLGGRDFLRLGVLEIAVGTPGDAEQAELHFDLWDLLRPTAFMLTGSQIQIYEAAAAARGIDLRRYFEGASLMFSEAVCQFPGPRRRIEERYGFRLHNLTGASEIPAFSNSDCRFHTGMHLVPGHHLIQVCDPSTGKPVAPGERGSLVVSSHGLDAFFLRYDLEDIVVEATDRCPCGETGQRYTFLGRGADRAEVDGRMILPLDVQLALEEGGAPEFQLVAGRHEKLRLRVELDGGGSGRIEGLIGEALSVPVTVDPVPVGGLPRSSFKPRRIATS